MHSDYKVSFYAAYVICTYVGSFYSSLVFIRTYFTYVHMYCSYMLREENYVRMYITIITCMYVCMYVHRYVRMYCICVVCMCVHIHTYVCMYTCMYITP